MLPALRFAAFAPPDYTYVDRDGPFPDNRVFMGFQGDLRSIDLSDLLQSMASRQQSGLLEIITRDGKWLLSLREGAIVGLNRRPPHDFWPRLVDNGILTAEQFREALGTTRKQALAKILIDGAFIKAERLRALFIEFIYDELCEVLMLRHGRVEMSENKFLDDKNWAALNVRLPVTKVILESARRHDHWEFVHRYIVGPGTVLACAFRAQQELEAGKGNEIAAAILARVRPDRSIGEIADSLPFSRSEVFREAAELVKHVLLRCVNQEDSTVTRPQPRAEAVATDEPATAGTAPAGTNEPETEDAPPADANEAPDEGTPPADANEAPAAGAAPADTNEPPPAGGLRGRPYGLRAARARRMVSPRARNVTRWKPPVAAARRARPAGMIAAAAAAVVAAALILFSSYEAYACSQFIALARECIHAGVEDPDGIGAAITKCRRFRGEHPAAFVATFHADKLIEELAAKQAALDPTEASADRP